MIIYLYVKTHNITGLKYLGKTQQNPFIYKGSGLYWKRHLKKYGNDVTTEILFQSENSQEIKEMGIYYSSIWDIVKNSNWANLIEESGTGGDTSKTDNYIKAKNSGLMIVKSKNKTYEEIFGEEKAKILKQKISEANLKRDPDFYKRISPKISKTRKELIKSGKIININPPQDILVCPHCSFATTHGNAKRWHFDNCKFKCD